MEIWKPLRNFPNYKGSTEGRIMNNRTQHILKPYLNEKGYEKVSLRKENHKYTVSVRKVLAETFLDERSGMDVRNKDFDRLNNKVNNLEWCSRQETVKSAFERGSKLQSRNIAIRVIETGKVYNSIRSCARDIGCSQTEISRYLAGKCPHVKGLHFERV